MNQHIVASTKTALADGQLADEAALLRDHAIDWGADDMAANFHGVWLRLTDRLRDDAIALAQQTGVVLNLRK